MGTLNRWLLAALALLLATDGGASGNDTDMPHFGMFTSAPPPGRACAVPAGGLNLTSDERAALRYVCADPSDVGAPPTLSARRGVPDGVNCNRTQWCDDLGCSEVCARGSVAVPPWLASASRLQARLSRALPLCFAPLLGTHNSAITLADGYGNLDPYYQALLKYVQWAVPDAGSAPLRTNDQWFSLTDQMEMGVRMVELDTHWVGGVLRIAHCGGLHVGPLNALVRALNVVARLLRQRVRWDTETLGCQPSLSSVPALEQRTLGDALREVRTWMDAPANRDEFLVLYLDDQPDLAGWGVVGKLQEELVAAFPLAWVFTQDDLAAAGGAWPSAAAMAARGRRLVVVSGTDYGAAMAPLIFARGAGVCGWREPGLERVEAAPACAVRPARAGAAPRRLFDGSLVRVSSCELEYGPLNCEFVWKGGNAPCLDEDTLPGVVGCGLNAPAPDLLTPARAAAAIWTWAEGHPFAAQARSGSLESGDPGGDGGGGLHAGGRAASCAAISAADARWRAAPCGGGGGALPSACRRAGGPPEAEGQWVLGEGPRGSCPQGAAFDLPRHPRENYELGALLRAGGREAAWLPVAGPGWEVDGMPAYRPPAAAAAVADA